MNSYPSKDETLRAQASVPSPSALPPDEPRDQLDLYWPSRSLYRSIPRLNKLDQRHKEQRKRVSSSAKATLNGHIYPNSLNNEQSHTCGAVRMETVRHTNQSTLVRIMMSYHATNRTGLAHAKYAMQCRTEAPGDEKNEKRYRKFVQRSSFPTKVLPHLHDHHYTSE